MLLQYTAAALASENKVLVHPASADSIPTSANQEDHVSMGPIAGRHARVVLDNVEKIVGLELLCAARALDLRLPLLDGAVPGAGVAAAHAAIREVVRPWEGDHEPGPDIEAATRLVREGAAGRARRRSARERDPHRRRHRRGRVRAGSHRCADPGFDHRTCDFWEDEKRGSKAARLAWLEPAPRRPEPRAATRSRRRGPAFNPFAPGAGAGPASNPFDPTATRRAGRQPVRPTPAFGAGRCTGRATEAPAAGPRPRGLRELREGARARRRGRPRTASSDRCPRTRGHSRSASSTRDCRAPHCPAVITCIATTTAARGAGPRPRAR